jgi:hypothetical protein
VAVERSHRSLLTRRSTNAGPITKTPRRRGIGSSGGRRVPSRAFRGRSPRSARQPVRGGRGRASVEPRGPEAERFGVHQQARPAVEGACADDASHYGDGSPRPGREWRIPGTTSQARVPELKGRRCTSEPLLLSEVRRRRGRCPISTLAEQREIDDDGEDGMRARARSGAARRQEAIRLERPPSPSSRPRTP